MKAVLYYGNSKGLQFEDVSIPEISSDEVLVKVSACGVCHTDLHYIEHGVPTFKKPPVILGHEAAGIIEKAGANVKNVKTGDRVLLPAVLTCGKCFLCRTGKENICQNMVMFGNHVDGAYAEYVKAPAKDVFILPSEIPLEEGAIIADAVSTPYHAIKNRAQVRPGDTVVIFGCGGVGINAVQLANIAGGIVIAVDVVDKKLEWAKKFGASYTINAKNVEKVSKEIKRMTGGGADIAIEAIGNPKTMEEAFNSIRNGGRLCVIGYTNEMLTVSAAKIMFQEMEIIGSLGCRPVDYPPLIKMVAAGKVNIKDQVTHKFKLQDLPKAFETMKKGESLRSVVIP